MLSYSRFYRGLVVAMALCLITVSMAAAAGSGPATLDTYTNLNAADTSYGSDVQLWATLSSSPSGACTVTRITYLQWDLTSVAVGSINTALLQLTRSGATSNPAGYSVSIYEVSDAWDEGSSYNTAPLPGALIETQAFPAANGDAVSFTSPALVTYLNSQAGGPASVAVQLSSPGACSATTTVVFYSRESTGTAPTLQLEDPNAVALSTFTTDTAAPTWPLYAGLGALALIAAAGVAWSRKRAALR